MQGILAPIPEKTILHGSKSRLLAPWRPNCEHCGIFAAISRNGCRDRGGMLGSHRNGLAVCSISGAPASSSLHAVGLIPSSYICHRLLVLYALVAIDSGDFHRFLGTSGGCHGR